MAEVLALDLVDKKRVTDQIVPTLGYDIENLTKPEIASQYKGEVTLDRYGRKTPKHAHGTGNIGRYTSSTKLITDTTLELFERIVNKRFTIRRVTLVANHVMDEDDVEMTAAVGQLDLFTNYAEVERKRRQEEEELSRERKMQETMLDIKRRYGKNAILRGTNFEEGATTKSRNEQIGGHKA